MTCRAVRLAAVLLTAALLAVACSDAHSPMQQQLSDNNGYDPNVLTVLAPDELTPVLRQLETGFNLVRPGTTLVFVSDVRNGSSQHGGKRQIDYTATEEISAGASPSLWIDLPPVLKPWADDPRANGAIVPFGDEPLVLVTRQGNPAHVEGLGVFLKGGATAGRCSTTAPCGKTAVAYLDAALGKAVYYDLKVPDAPSLLKAIQTGKVDAGMVFSLDAEAALSPGVDIVKLPTATPHIQYNVLRMSPNPTAEQFVQWLSTSAAAHQIMTDGGLLPPPTPSS
jgi:ABC-type molybdate transport system substrate-binding protein